MSTITASPGSVDGRITQELVQGIYAEKYTRYSRSPEGSFDLKLETSYQESQIMFTT